LLILRHTHRSTDSAVVMATNSQILVHAARQWANAPAAAAAPVHLFMPPPYTRGWHHGNDVIQMRRFAQPQIFADSAGKLRARSLASRPPARTIDSFPGARVELRLYFRVRRRANLWRLGSLVALIDRTPRARIQSPLGAKKCPLGRCACKRGRRSGGGERNHADGLLEITHAEGKRRINS
jgi:hypothetical protein